MTKEFSSEVKLKVPEVYEHFVSLRPFDDVISSYWIDSDEQYVGIGIDVGGFVFPSGDHSQQGAMVYKDRVVLFEDTHSGGSVFREEHVTDMAGLWAYLRQLPRPISSFGKWVGERES